MANFIQFKRTRRSSTSSIYMQLLSSLAADLDNMLSELCTTPPPPYDHLTDTELHNRSDAFLEPYLQGLNDRHSPVVCSPSQSQLPLNRLKVTTTSPLPASSPPTRSASRASLLSSNGGSEAGSEDSEETDYGTSCDIGLMERLIRSHPIWFLPGIQRAGAFHLLQGKEEGCFVVRQSSQTDTMALSVRLPPDKGPYIEHYLIQSNDGRLGLETSENRFDNMPALIAHYAQCCDELPVQLNLPKQIKDAKSRQQLSSLALLGQEFWRYSPPITPEDVTTSTSDLVLNLNPLMMTTFKTETAASIQQQQQQQQQQDNKKATRPNTLNLVNLIEPSKIPPPPPLRWSKPSTPQQNLQTINDLTEKNGILSPSESILSPNSDPNSSDTLSPLSFTKTGRNSKRSKQKLTKHYQESDIVDSPTMLYYRSGLNDKISDYEDVWTNNNNNNNNNNDDLKQLKNHCQQLPSPDLIQNTPNIILLNNNTSSPKNDEKSHLSHMPKQGSPFYAEPADALTNNLVPPRRLLRNFLPIQRHSNPPSLLSPINSNNGGEQSNNFISNSVDNLSLKQRLNGIKKPDVKPVLPPFIKPKLNETWQVDNGWKFLTNEFDTTVESSDPDYDSDWPTIPNLLTSLQPYQTPESDEHHIQTVQEMISKRFPDIRTSSLELSTTDEFSRISAYDNVIDNQRIIPKAPPSEISELTEFSDPWREVSQSLESDDSIMENNNNHTKLATVERSKSFKDRLDPLLSVPRLQALRNREQIGPKLVGAAIRTYALELAKDKTTTFAQNIDNFIACTCESKETNPQITMRNMRQFMSGMKNYLVKHGEKGFYKEIERERSKLKSTEFLNLDAILEGVMHKLVVKPLKSHLQKLFLDYYTKTGAIRLLADNIQYASTRPISELAIKPKINLPSENSLNTISKYLQHLQNADSPLEKLEYLLAAIATIFNSVKTIQLNGSCKSMVQLGADDFLPLFVWVLVRTNFIAAEIEAEYMWGLLHPSLLSGEGGYYLTTLSSAVHVLKNFKESCEENLKNSMKSDSVLKVVVPDELHGSILTKTLPARPHMTTKEVCKIIAHKARITNPQDYALYRLTDGEETMLLDNECPQDFMNEGKHTMLAYKRIDAKIAWPNQDKLSI